MKPAFVLVVALVAVGAGLLLLRACVAVEGVAPRPSVPGRVALSDHRAAAADEAGTPAADHRLGVDLAHGLDPSPPGEADSQLAHPSEPALALPPPGATPRPREKVWAGRTQRQWADFYANEFTESRRALTRWEAILRARTSGQRVDEAALDEAHAEIDRLRRRIEVSRLGLQEVKNGRPPPDLDAAQRELDAAR